MPPDDPFLATCRARLVEIQARIERHEKGLAEAKEEARAVQELIQRLEKALTSPRQDDTLATMATSGIVMDTAIVPRRPGRPPKFPSLVTETVVRTGKSIRALAREIGIKETTLKQQSRRNSVPDDVAAELRKIKPIAMTKEKRK